MSREVITARAHGIDVSHHQDTYVYAKTWGQVDFAIAKIGQGYNSPYQIKYDETHTNFTDFNKIWLGGVDQVKRRGVYFYQMSGYSWQQQADLVLEAIEKLATKPQMLWLDLEKIGNTVDATMLADSKRILDYWKINAPSYLTKIGLYDNKDICQYYLETIGVQQYGQQWLDEMYAYPQWFAQYWNVPDPNKEPALSPKLKRWDIWQYTQYGDSNEYRDGTLWRHYGSPDLNVFNGTPAEMDVWLGIEGDEPPPDPPPIIIPPQESTMQVTAKVKVNIRADHSTASADVGDFAAGQVADVLELYPASVPANTEQWARIAGGWVAVYYGAQLCTLSGTLTPPPASDPVTIDINGAVAQVKLNGAIVYP